MTPLPFLIAVAVIAVICAIVTAWAEREEKREEEKLKNYRQAEALQRARGKFVTLEYYPRGI